MFQFFPPSRKRSRIFPFHGLIAPATFFCISAFLCQFLDIAMVSAAENKEKSWIKRKLESIDERQRKLSTHVSTTAEWMDSFFDNEIKIEEYNKSRIKLSLKGAIEEGRGFESNVGTGLRFVLPGLEQRVSVALSGATDEEGATAVDSNPDERKVNAPSGDKEGFNAALRYMLFDELLTNLRLDGGLRFHGFNIEPFSGIRFRRTFPLHLWEIRFTQRAYWYGDTGVEINSQLDLDRKIAGTNLLRFTPKVSWYKKKQGLFYGMTATYFQHLNENHAFQYKTFIKFVTHPDDVAPNGENRSSDSSERNVVDDGGLEVIYRHRLHKHWLYGEAAIWARFPRDRDYERTLGLYYKIDVFFGYMTE